MRVYLFTASREICRVFSVINQIEALFRFQSHSVFCVILVISAQLLFCLTPGIHVARTQQVQIGAGVQ